MANIPGIIGTITPQVVSRVRTLTRAVSIPGGLRTLCIVGEGLREEVIVDSAVGGGQDGFNPTFTSQSDSYGRYFKTANTNLIPNRTLLYINEVPLRVLEEAIDGTTFPSRYDARLDPDTGEIELQSASIVDQGGGTLYSVSSANVGDAYLTTPTLVDINAPAETWTIRCTGVLRDGSGNPIRGQATFLATGSVSGRILDSYGQPIVWRSDGIAVSNTIISFAILNPTGSITDVGDRFTIEITSKVLQARDQLTARYIAEIDLNSPQTFTDPDKLFAAYGTPSLTNTLSLGAQMAFENGATSVLAVQAKPPLPRRTSEIVLAARDSITGTGGATGTSTADDLIFPITSPGKPDGDTSIHFFIINTDGTEDQIFPNKVTFYDTDITAAYSQYEQTGVSTNLMLQFMNPAQSGYLYSYTVVSDDIIMQSGSDGYIDVIGAGSTGWFHSPSAQFTVEYLDAYLDFHNTTTANNGRYQIIEIASETKVKITRTSGFFVHELNIKWQLLLEGENSQRILFTTDLALAAGKGLRVSYIDQADATFYDAGWADALDVLEAQELQMLVLLPTQTFSAIQQAGRVHVDRMSSTFYKKERILLTGAIKGLTVDNVTGVSLAAPEDIGILEGIQGDSAEDILDGNIEDLADYSVANSFGDTFRVVYFYPDEIIRVINGSNEAISGYWLAPAAAGYLAGEPNIAQPLTNKTLIGFSILNDKMYKQTVLNTLADNGITTVQPVTGGGVVIWGITTTNSGAPEEEEISIVAIRDYVAKTMRESFRTFIGKPESPILLPSLTNKALGLLNAFVSQNLITSYRNLSVARDDVEPRQYNVRVEIQPNYPVNWIFIDISVGLF